MKVKKKKEKGNG